ncbi:IS701 family transposase [Streptomyces bluensis]|uniref:IS701 family transposase n=1 Tax=Streptomyces bluensis TaxID=33897 RepID=UPI001E2C932B|nr:IS701 family transposase [Streptomyces bluensis]
MPELVGFVVLVMVGVDEAGLWAGELESVLARVAGRFSRVDLRWRMRDYVRGLLAPVERKNGWQLAEYAGHRGPAGFQHLLNGAAWDVDAVRDDVQNYVAEGLGTPDGVLIVDDTGFLKKGTTSAGVQRQYSGTAGRTENCRIGVFAAYASAKGRALVDRELYLPQSWTSDADRCRAAKVPDSRVFATKGELARAMTLRAPASPLPIAWVTGDCAYGQEWRMRRTLEEAGVGYVLAVPKSQRLHAPFGRTTRPSPMPPARHGKTTPAATVPKARASTIGPPHACRRSASSTATGPPTSGGYRAAAAWPARTRLPTLAYAPNGTSVADLVRIAGSRWAIEEAFQTAKNECGPDQYEVRRYPGWYRHITLAMLAHVFLSVVAAQATERGAAETTPPAPSASRWQRRNLRSGAWGSLVIQSNWRGRPAWPIT